MSRHKKYILLIMAIAIIIAVGVAGSPKKNTNVAQTINKTSVEVQEAKTISTTTNLSFKANLDPIKEGIVGSKISGQVTRILFEDGDRVTQGQALIALDDVDLNNKMQAAQINLQKLQVTLESNQRSYERTKILYESGAKSASEMQDAETELKLAKANIAAEEVTIQGINNSLNDSVVRAPISGVISDKKVSLGQYVNPGTVLATVNDISSIKAVIQVKQSDLASIKVGQKAVLKLSKGDTAVYEGIVKNIDASANTSTRVFDCVVQIDNQEAKLRSGVFGYIEIGSDEKKDILAIPLTALAGSEGSYSVFTMEGNAARKHSVSVGNITENMAEITSGIKAGDKIIITNLNSLQDGDKVEVSGQGD